MGFTMQNKEAERRMKILAQMKVEEWDDLFNSFETSGFTENSTQEEIDKRFNELELAYPTLKQEFQQFPFPLWRVRNKKSWIEELDNESISQSFSYPPSRVLDKVDRAHLAYHPVFYCSDSVQTAIAESKMKIGEVGYLGRWVFNPIYTDEGVVVNPLLKFRYEERELKQENSPFLNKALEQINKVKKPYGDVMRYLKCRYGELFLREEQKHYILSSWLAHKFIYSWAHEMDGINYPSVANQFNGTNYAFHPNFANARLLLSCVFEFKLEENTDANQKIHISRVGKVKRNHVKWFPGNTLERAEIEFCFGREVDIDSFVID